MNKQEIYDYFQSLDIPHEISEHEAVFNMAELNGVDLLYPDRDAKNLFVRDDKKRNYYLITVKGDKRVNLKDFRKEHGLRALSFASEKDLMTYMQLIPGAVTPLGLLNDESMEIKLFLDEDFFDESSLIGVHPNDNTATIWLDVQDLKWIIENHGNEVEVVTL